MAENSADIAKRIILGCIAEGMTVDAACASAGKSMKTYEYYRRTDKVFADKMDRTRLGLKDKAFASGDVHDISFAEFRERFLNSKTFAHQQNLIDLIEGRTPGWLHPSMKYDVAVWAKWAETAGIDGRCINFMLMHPELVTQRVNPRAITTFFNAISSIPKFEDDLPLIQMIGEGSVGADFSSMFTMFINNKLDKLISPEDGVGLVDARLFTIVVAKGPVIPLGK